MLRYTHIANRHTLSVTHWLLAAESLRDAHAVGMSPSFYKTRSSVANVPTSRLYWMRNVRQREACAIWGYRRGASENARLLGCEAVSFLCLHEQMKASCSIRCKPLSTTPQNTRNPVHIFATDLFVRFICAGCITITCTDSEVFLTPVHICTCPQTFTLSCRKQSVLTSALKIFVYRGT